MVSFHKVVSFEDQDQFAYDEFHVSELTRLAASAHQQGEFVVVEQILNHMQELQNHAPDLESLCHLLSELGTLYEVIGRATDALNTYRHALKVSLSLNDPVAIGNARGRLTRLSIQQQSAKRTLKAVENEQPSEAPTPAFLPQRREPERVKVEIATKQRERYPLYLIC